MPLNPLKGTSCFVVVGVLSNNQVDTLLILLLTSLFVIPYSYFLCHTFAPYIKHLCFEIF
jgi:hypothetical protein